MITDRNRSSQGFFQRREPEDCLLVIFGGSGDLAKKKLFPALGNLYWKKMMPAKWKILAVGRKQTEIPELLQGHKYPADFADKIEYLQTDYTIEGISKLKKRCEELAHQLNMPLNYLFYLAVPPNSYAELAKALKQGGLVSDHSQSTWSRIVVEKPYGRDLRSAVELNENLLKCFSENQIYRIDHYLGKEAVQNLLVFRFANRLFEPVWNSNYIDNIQISASEMIGCEDRAAYFEQSGIVRDMIQNHLMQIFCLVAMESPAALSADAIRDEKVKVLRSLRPMDFTDPAALESPFAIRGQYSAGFVKGQEVKAYREEKGINPQSPIDTFAALRLHIDNFRWAGVPFYMRTGKRLGRKGTEVVVNFKSLPRLLFNTQEFQLQQNRIVFKIQPQEGILIEITSKNPGQSFELSDTSMKFCYNEAFDTSSADAYERLLLDAICGDATLFVRSDETELSWRFLDPLLEEWTKKPMGKKFPNYASGSEGPESARDILINGLKHWSDFSKYDNVC